MKKSLHSQPKHNSEFIHHFLWAGVQPSPGKQGSIQVTVTWKDKHLNSEPSLPFLLTPNLIAEHDAIRAGTSLVIWGQLSCLCPLPAACTPAPLWWEGANAITLCKRCPAITKTSLCYLHCFQHQSKIWSHTGCYEEI